MELGLVILLEVLLPRHKATANHLFRDLIPTLAHALGHAGDGGFRSE